ncbi:hypothetical protein EYC84_006310 [Monilinia fructicola]|uniref:Uncharacterized protein n=1 Tax=Monilinia fructicola TaxID=38448 RepID=A0A5M9KB64_MONFR|nr:hypothetical protein EYC84_006310 [Monilinia fructicola]
MARLCSKAASPSEVHLETPGSKATGANTLPVSLGLNLFFTRDGREFLKDGSDNQESFYAMAKESHGSGIRKTLDRG